MCCCNVKYGDGGGRGGRVETDILGPEGTYGEEAQGRMGEEKSDFALLFVCTTEHCFCLVSYLPLSGR